jgi:hypothetical protein
LNKQLFVACTTGGVAYAFFLRGMCDTLGTIQIGCVVAVLEMRNAFYSTAPKFGKIEEKTAQCKEKNTEALSIALYTIS